jgi:hypothetical protein
MSNQRRYSYQTMTQCRWFKASQRLIMRWHLFNFSHILAYIRSWKLEEQSQDSANFIVPLFCQIKKRIEHLRFLIKVCILEILSLSVCYVLNCLHLWLYIKCKNKYFICNLLKVSFSSDWAFESLLLVCLSIGSLLVVSFSNL